LKSLSDARGREFYVADQKKFQMEVKAIGRNIRVQPRKVRIVADQVRGKPAAHSSILLRFHPSKAARVLRKVLDSAIAKAESSYGLSADGLKIASVSVDEGPRLKRIQPRAMGRAFRIVKKSSHITVVLDEFEPPSKPSIRKKAKPRPKFEAGKRKAKPRAEGVVEEIPAEASVEASEETSEETPDVQLAEVDADAAAEAVEEKTVEEPGSSKEIETAEVVVEESASTAEQEASDQEEPKERAN